MKSQDSHMSKPPHSTIPKDANVSNDQVQSLRSTSTIFRGKTLISDKTNKGIKIKVINPSKISP